jgi:hypothetical protein
MNEAAQTNVSAGGIWAIVAVAVVCLAFWLVMLAVASQNPGGVRERRRRMSGPQGPVLGGTHVSDCRRSVSPTRDSPATFSDAEADAFLAREMPGAAEPGVSEPGATEPGVTVPGQRAPGAAPTPGGAAQGQPGAGAVPTQRDAGADQPQRTRAGPDDSG